VLDWFDAACVLFRRTGLLEAGAVLSLWLLGVIPAFISRMARTRSLSEFSDIKDLHLVVFQSSLYVETRIKSRYTAAYD